MEPKPDLDNAMPPSVIRAPEPSAKSVPEVETGAGGRFWKNLRDAWLPGVACTLLGVFLGWWVSFKDTQTQIDSLQEANQSLATQKGILEQQNKTLQDQAVLLHEQNGRLTTQGAALSSQAITLASILKAVAGKGHGTELALDRRGNITLEGKPIVDSKGNLLTDESGHVLTTDSGIPLSTEGPSPATRERQP
jgi:hypothetical protein